MKLCVLLFAAGASAYGCQMVAGDHIRAADLAAVAPAFRALDLALEIGLSPLPGIQRVISTGDLVRLARANGIELAGTPAEVCFERRGKSAGRSASPAAAIAPLAVHGGDKVAVTVTSGRVLLRFESEAESSGRPGDTVIILNPESGSRFVARVEGKGKVSVDK